MISINFRDSRPIYIQIKENIIKMIMAGSLKQDDRLPSVRELAVELAINPNTIQRAYRELESEGYIYVASGKGTFVAPHGEARADTEKLMESFRNIAAKLIFNGVDGSKLKDTIDTIGKEVNRND